jgi:hypothetical protein
MVNRETHGSQRLRRIISGRISRLAGGRAPVPADMAELLPAILRAAIDVALVGQQIDPEPFGRESDSLLRREPLCFDIHVEHFNSYKFARLYRISKEDFASLVTLFDPRLRRTHSRPDGCAAAVDPRVLTAVTLRYLAGGRILDIGWPYGLVDATVYNVIDELIDAIDAALQDKTFPSTAHDAERSRCVGGVRESPLYGIISAIDGIAVEIRCPTAADCSNPTSYYNRKGFYTIRVQAAILTNYKVCFLST